MNRVSKAGEPCTSSLGASFAWIPPGDFMMGSTPGEEHRSEDEVLHRVLLTRGLFLGIHPVTQAWWEAVMGSNPSHFRGEHLPVDSVTWNDSLAFCQALSQREGKKYRLPTEAEWEYACRAGSATMYHCGNGPGALGDHAWYNQNAQGRTHPVGQKKPNAWGLHDVHGNVWEWCSDRYGDYPAQPVSDPQGAAAGDWLVLRGGSWHDGDWIMRSASRNWNVASYRFKIVGVRVAFDLE